MMNLINRGLHDAGHRRRSKKMEADDDLSDDGVVMLQQEMIVSDDRLVEYEEDLVGQLAKLRKNSPGKAKYLVLAIAGLAHRGLGSKLRGVRQVSERLQIHTWTC